MKKIKIEIKNRNLFYINKMKIKLGDGSMQRKVGKVQTCEGLNEVLRVKCESVKFEVQSEKRIVCNV